MNWKSFNNISWEKSAWKDKSKRRHSEKPGVAMIKNFTKQTEICLNPVKIIQKKSIKDVRKSEFNLGKKTEIKLSKRKNIFMKRNSSWECFTIQKPKKERPSNIPQTPFEDKQFYT